MGGGLCLNGTKCGLVFVATSYTLSLTPLTTVPACAPSSPHYTPLVPRIVFTLDAVARLLPLRRGHRVMRWLEHDEVQALERLAYPRQQGAGGKQGAGSKIHVS